MLFGRKKKKAVKTKDKKKSKKKKLTVKKAYGIYGKGSLDRIKKMGL